MVKKNNRNLGYDDYADAEVQRKYLVPEEFPEGPYGSQYNKLENVRPKEARKGQRHFSAFNYEYKSLHEDLPRQYPIAHPPHDQPDQDVKPPDENQ
ncbi:MAG: cytosolic protein [Bacillaceae bacterium]|nr:cytosolic protein [Bacillaceae bacterium]